MLCLRMKFVPATASNDIGWLRSTLRQFWHGAMCDDAAAWFEARSESEYATIAAFAEALTPGSALIPVSSCLSCTDSLRVCCQGLIGAGLDSLS